MRLLLLPISLSLAAPLAAVEPIAGRWITPEGDSRITIGPCGDATCGRISAFLRSPPTPNPKDINNPTVALRDRSILGLAVLSGFVDAGREWRGRIYDPRSGRSYRSVVSRNPDGTLKVQGCIAFLCRMQIWRAAE